MNDLTQDVMWIKVCGPNSDWDPYYLQYQKCATINLTTMLFVKKERIYCDSEY